MFIERFKLYMRSSQRIFSPLFSYCLQVSQVDNSFYWKLIFFFYIGWMDTNIEKKPEINVLSRISSIHRYSFMRGTMSGTGIGWRKEMKQVHRRNWMLYATTRHTLVPSSRPRFHLDIVCLRVRYTFWMSRREVQARQSLVSLTKSPHNHQPATEEICLNLCVAAQTIPNIQSLFTFHKF